MMYALLIYAGTSQRQFDRLSDTEQRSIVSEFMALGEEHGVLGHGQLQPPESSTTVRAEHGKTLTTDGPFANTKEILGGLYLLEADNLDQALEFASRIPTTRLGGVVEVRPMVGR